MASSNSTEGRRLGSSSNNDCEAAGKQAFEACPFYLGEHLAARVIRSVFPAMKAVAIMRNPRERTVSAFNDYVRVGRIKGASASAMGMEAMVREKLQLLASGQRGLEDYDMRVLTSGVYIHGLRAWGAHWPSAQLLVLRSEDLFAHTDGTMSRVQRFLGLTMPLRAGVTARVRNKNTMKSKSKPSRALNETLDAFFAPYNEQLYAWARQRGIAFERWPNATAAR